MGGCVSQQPSPQPGYEKSKDPNKLGYGTIAWQLSQCNTLNYKLVERTAVQMVLDAMRDYDSNQDGKIDKSDADLLCEQTWKYMCWLDPEQKDKEIGKPDYANEKAFQFFTNSNEADAIDSDMLK